MQDLHDQELEKLLREHLAAELDPYVGRAAAGFGRKSRRRALRIAGWSSLSLAAAAAGILIMGLVFRIPDRSASSDSSPVAPPVIAVVPVEHDIAWDTTDLGTVFVNGEFPMRGIRRQRLDSLRWSDPQTRATFQMQVPHDEIVLIGLNAN